MKIIAIGNSFSQDATTYIEDIAASVGRDDLVAANLYIPGCPLERHAHNILTNEPEYEYQRHGKAIYKTCIREALALNQWDVVSLQQVSGLSGIYESYHPYFEEVLNTVRELCPTATIKLHRTWAYEEQSSHPDFARYDHNRVKMDAAIEDVCQKISNEYHLSILPTGNIVTKAKSIPAFDIANGGISLYRDRFHMSYSYGRYLVAGVWLRTLLGIKMSSTSFLPTDTNPTLINELNAILDSYVIFEG